MQEANKKSDIDNRVCICVRSVNLLNILCFCDTFDNITIIIYSDKAMLRLGNVWNLA